VYGLLLTTDLRYKNLIDIGVRARGWGLQPLRWAKANFSGRSQQLKMIKNIIFLYLLNEKNRNIMKCPKSGIFTNYYCVG